MNLCNDLSCDLFVSYAHSDDQVPLDASNGWVTTFTTELAKVLQIKLGGDGATIFMDHALAANAVVTDELREKVTASRCLLLFLSPGYLESNWCKGELGQFLEVNSARKNKENVFVVEIEPQRRDEWPNRLKALNPYQFYKREIDGSTRLLGYPRPPSDPDHSYWIQILSLSDSIAKHLKSMRNLTALPPKDVTSASSLQGTVHVETTVWVAQPPVELLGEWHKIVEALKQIKIRTLPSAPDSYPLDSTERLKAAIQSDLKEARLLVQLFSGDIGVTVDGGQGSLATIQASVAQVQVECQSGLRYFRWRHPDLRLEAIADSNYRALLCGADACGFEQFRQSLVERAKSLSAPPPVQVTPQSTENLTICVSGGAKDARLCDEVSEIIKDLGHTALNAPAVPDEKQSFSEYRSQIEEMLSAVEGVILVYGEEAALWILAKYPQVKKVLDGQGRRFKKGLLEGPPPGKASVGLAGSDIFRLDCRQGVSRNDIQSYIAVLKGVTSGA